MAQDTEIADNTGKTITTALVINSEDNEVSNELMADLKALNHAGDGRFTLGNTAANKGRHSLAKKAAAFVRARLAAIDPNDPLGRSKLEIITNNLIDIAANTDARSRKEAVWAFNSLMERAFGQPLKSEEELEAMAKGGVQFVFAALPHLPNPLPELPEPQPVFDADGYQE